MYPDVFEKNRQVRRDQIIKLFNSICSENPLTIDVTKITEKILTINLGFVLAFIRSGCKSFSDIIDALNKPGVNSMAKAITEQIHEILKNEQLLNDKEIKFLCIDEPRLDLEAYTPNKPCYLLPPKISIPLLERHFNASLKRESDLEKPSEKNVEPTKNDTIKKMLEEPLINIIKDINPLYKGGIHIRTSAPHKLLIRVIAIMVKLETPNGDITWQSIHQFIDQHIYQHQPFSETANLEEVTEDTLIVKGHPITKRNCQNGISRYKNKIFGLT